MIYMQIIILHYYDNNNKKNNRYATMTSPIFYRFSQQKFLFKGLELDITSPYILERRLMLVFTPYSHFGMEQINASLSGRVSPIALSQAEKIARVISEHLSLAVMVVKGLKLPEHKKNEVLEVDAQGNQKPKGNFVAEDVWVPTALEINRPDRLRAVIEFLEDRAYISTEDKTYLDPYLSEIEQKFAVANQLTPTITQAQKDFLSTTCMPSIKALIAACEDKTLTNASILGNVTWCSFDSPFTKRNLALCLLMKAMQSDYATLFGEMFGGLRTSCGEPGRFLCTVYGGHAKLEPALAKLGTGVPYLTTQRQFILELIEQQLTQHFGPEE